MKQLALQEEITRPLKVLVPMIKEELELGNAAGLEHYRKAGEMLLEAKSQVAHGEWKAWLERNFSLGRNTAWTYMKLVPALKAQKSPAVDFSSMRQVLRLEQSLRASA